MAQALAVRSSTQSHTQSSTEVGQQQSLALMKNLVRASISEVCFIRNLFPSDVFKETRFGSTVAGQAQEIINEDAWRLVQWQDAAFEALDKRYLKYMVFGIYSAEPDPRDRELLESYVYHFKYPNDEEVELVLQRDGEAFSVNRLRDHATSLVRSLIRLCETMRPMPQQRIINLKLFYYDDRMPEDAVAYNPPHFHDATFEEHPFFSTAPLKVQVGTVTSKHYGLTLKVAFREDFENEDLELSAHSAAGASTVPEAAFATPAPPTPKQHNIDTPAVVLHEKGAGTATVDPHPVEVGQASAQHVEDDISRGMMPAEKRIERPAKDRVAPVSRPAAGTASIPATGGGKVRNAPSSATPVHRKDAPVDDEARLEERLLFARAVVLLFDALEDGAAVTMSYLVRELDIGNDVARKLMATLEDRGLVSSAARPGHKRGRVVLRTPITMRFVAEQRRILAAQSAAADSTPRPADSVLRRLRRSDSIVSPSAMVTPAASAGTKRRREQARENPPAPPAKPAATGSFRTTELHVAQTPAQTSHPRPLRSWPTSTVSLWAARPQGAADASALAAEW